ncbi:MAG: hypothetical protein ACYS8W_03395 [Planctomycetota bacterium]|jgi:hypothetical protein
MTEQLYGINNYLPADKVPEAFRNDYHKVANDFKQASKEYFKGEPSSNVVKLLNNVFWDSLGLLVKIRVRDPLFESIGFSEEERPLVDFGLLSGEFLQSSTALDAIRKESGLSEHFEDFRILTLSQEIRFRFNRIIADPEIVSLKKDLEVLEREIEAIEERYNKARDRRSKVYKYIKGAEAAAKLAASIEERLTLYAKLQYKISRSVRLDQAEAEVVRVTDHDFEMLGELEKRLIQNRRSQEQVKELGAIIAQAALAVPKIMGRIGETRERIQNRMQNSVSASPTERFGKLYAELGEIQKLYPRFSGKEAARGILPVYFAEGLGVTKAQARSRLNEVVEIDKVLKKMWHDRMWKRPDVIMVPGLGDGVYDAARDAFWIPRRNLYPFKDPVVSAVALYRFAKSDGMADRYRNVKKIPRRTRDAIMAEDFVKEYNDCVLREAKGFRRLSGKLQKWFRYEFAYEEGA